MLTLLTDFGLQDIYVGVMKGIIAQINPVLKVIDLSHQIPPQDIASARFCLMSAYPYFPPGTVHVAVVDPGVGGSRRVVGIEIESGFLVGPDNGLFSGILSQCPVQAVVELTHSHYWRTPQLSMTFQGRDLFAPVGAHLANGIPLTDLGELIDPRSLVQFPIQPNIQTDDEITGSIQYIDHFGNLVSTISGSEVEGKDWGIQLGNQRIPSGNTFSDTQPGELISLVGSHGWVEIAVNQGSARSRLQLGYGDPIHVINNF